MSELGRGAMGIVYRAKDLDLPREVALKHIWPELAENEIVLARFRREARAASRLLHPHIVPVFEVFQEAGRDWIVMELVEGETLRARLRRGPLSMAEALAHAEGLADALQFAHAKGIVHRDLSPKNVLIDDQGRARLTDFGLVRFVAGESESADSTMTSLTGDGVIVGTMAYMSPEQALGRPVDARSDLFSLGAVLYESCTGQSPFPTASQGDLLDGILHHEPQPIARFNYEVPAEYERIVRKCLRKAPEERYQDARELQADLRSLRREIDERPSPEPERRSLRLAMAAVAVVMLAAVGYAAWRVWSRPDDPPVPAIPARQITAAPGWEQDPALSPDGQFIAYVSDESGRPDLWLTDVRGGNSLQLTDDDAIESAPAWLPDGSAILFASDRDGRIGIWKVPRLGGSASLVLAGATDPAVSLDGHRLAYAVPVESGSTRIGVATLDRTDAGRLVTDGDTTGGNHEDPAWSPDGSRIAYSDGRTLWMVDVKDGSRKRLTLDGLGDREPVWSPDGRYVYFASARSGTFALWRVAARGGQIQRITAGSGPESGPTLSRDGSRLGFTTSVVDWDLELFDSRSGERTRLAALGYEVDGDLAPDGSAVVFSSNRWSQIALWVQPLVDGRPSGAPWQLTDHPGAATNPAYSPDGRWIAYHRMVDGEHDIWVIPSAGGETIRFTESPGIDHQPAWSPDGRQIVFTSDRENQRNQIWIRGFEAGRPRGAARCLPTPDLSVLAPEWSPDGTRIGFVGWRQSEAGAYVLPLDRPDELHPVTETSSVHRMKWESDQFVLVSGIWDTRQLEIRRFPANGGPGQRLSPPIDFGPEGHVGDFDLVPGLDLLVMVREEVHGDLWLMESRPGSF